MIFKAIIIQRMPTQTIPELIAPKAYTQSPYSSWSGECRYPNGKDTFYDPLGVPFNTLSPNISIQILQTDPYIFLEE